MDSTITYIRIVFEMLHHTHPRIYARMKEIIASIDGGDAFMLTMSAVFQWFVCLFTNSGLQKSIRLLVLDYFLVEGVPALFKAALALFDHLQDKILSVHEFGTLALMQTNISKQLRPKHSDSAMRISCDNV